MENSKLLTGPWTIEQLNNKEIGMPNNGLNVFSCFHCGGGSSFGYKLAGFNVIGGVEIDKEMMQIYRANHNPKHSYLMGVQDFKKIPNESLPQELFNLDILDGSPPCSSFSMAGNREKNWGENKKFREGQTEQVLDDLFFDFIDIAKKLKPKIVVAENVKGLIQGKAKGYVKMIHERFNDANYDVQFFLLNAAFMGVPQYRERTFFIAKRKDLELPKIKMDFKEPLISVETAINGAGGNQELLTESFKKWWILTSPGKAFSSVHPKGSYFGSFKLNPKNPCNTIIATDGAVISHWQKPVKLSENEISRLQTFPDDYINLNINKKYVCGMSVPPLMMQRIAHQIYEQWLKTLLQ